jgi:hypothetical protein
MLNKILVSCMAAGATAYVYMNMRKPEKEKDMGKKVAAVAKHPGVIKEWGAVWFK